MKAIDALKIIQQQGVENWQYQIFEVPEHFKTNEGIGNNMKTWGSVYLGASKTEVVYTPKTEVVLLSWVINGEDPFAREQPALHCIVDINKEYINVYELE